MGNVTRILGKFQCAYGYFSSFKRHDQPQRSNLQIRRFLLAGFLPTFYVASFDVMNPGIAMRSRNAFPTISLAVVLLIIFGWIHVAIQLHQPLFQPQKSAALLSIAAVNGPSFFGGEFWRILTSQFLHVHFLHMMLNAISIFVIGTAIESCCGRITIGVVYFVGGSICQFFSVLLRPELVSSGASQALMALCGFVIVGSGRMALPKYAVIAAVSLTFVQAVLDIYTSGGLRPGHSGGFGAGVAMAILAFATNSVRRNDGR